MKVLATTWNNQSEWGLQYLIYWSRDYDRGARQRSRMTKASAELNTVYDWCKTPKTWLLVLRKRWYLLLAEELDWRWYETGADLIVFSGDLQEFK